MIISRPFLLRMRNVSVIIVEKIKTHRLCSVTFFSFAENRAVYVEKYFMAGQDTDDNTALAHCVLGS